MSKEKIGEQIWVAEYSAKQNAFHVDLLAASIEANLDAVIKKHNNDFLIFYASLSHEACHRACDQMREVHEK